MGAIHAHHGLLLGATAGATDPLATSIMGKLVSWWEMDEASGTRYDSRGSNHLSNIQGSPSTGTGVRGGGDVAAAFAADAGLRASSSTTLQVPSGGGDHCWFGWFYVTSGNCMLMAKWDAINASTMEYGAEVDTSGLYAENGMSTYYYPTGPRPSNGAWHLFIGWRDSADGKVRQCVDDGTVYVSASASDPSPTGNDLGFGQAGSSTAARLNGRLQRWGWIKGAILDSTERTWLYNSGQGRTYAEIAALA